MTSSKYSFECNICRNVVFSTTFALSRHQNWCKNRGFYPHAKNQLHSLNKTLALNDLNNFGIEEDDDIDKNIIDHQNDTTDATYPAHPCEMLSTILNNTSESNHHDNNDLNFNEEDTINTKIFDKYEF